MAHAKSASRSLLVSVRRCLIFSQKSLLQFRHILAENQVLILFLHWGDGGSGSAQYDGVLRCCTCPRVRTCTAPTGRECSPSLQEFVLLYLSLKEREICQLSSDSAGQPVENLRHASGPVCLSSTRRSNQNKLRRDDSSGSRRMTGLLQQRAVHEASHLITLAVFC